MNCTPLLIRKLRALPASMKLHEFLRKNVLAGAFFVQTAGSMAGFLRCGPVQASYGASGACLRMYVMWSLEMGMLCWPNRPLQ